MPNYTTYNIKMVKGDTESFGFEVTGIDSLDTAFFSCKRNSQDAEYVFQKGLGYGITQDENNCFAVRIAPADTKELDPGQYWYDLEIGVNGDVFTIFRGVLELLPQITQSISPRADATWGYITGNIDNQIDLQAELNAKANISSLSTVATSGSYTDLTNTPNLAVVATSGSYNDLSNTPNLATVATTGAYSDLTGTPNLATVATSGSYNDLTNKPTIPTKTSDLTNDSNFVASTSLATVATTGAYSDLTGTPNLAAVATSGSYNDLTNKPSIPTKTSDLTNDSNFVVSSSLAAVATSGSYNDLSNKPTIPTKTSDLTNDSSFVASTSLATVATTGAYADLTGTPNLAAVATSGSYNDLSNTPNLATVATSGSYADLSNTPNLATVATTGSYADLSNTPNLAAVATSGSYNDLIDKPSVPGLASVIDAVYPVGSYYWNANSTSPATLFGVGTWTQITNQFIFAAGGDYASGDTGGEATHTLTIAEIPNHNHRLCDSEGYSVYGDIQTSTGPASGEGFGKSTYRLFTARTGGGGAHNNMPPYLVAYCWRRDT